MQVRNVGREPKWLSNPIQAVAPAVEEGCTGPNPARAEQVLGAVEVLALDTLIGVFRAEDIRTMTWRSLLELVQAAMPSGILPSPSPSS